MPKLIARALALACLVISATTHAQPVLTFDPVITSGLSAPVDIVNAADGSGKIYVVERGGTIKVYSSSFDSIGVFLTISPIRAGGETGLLSMAFHPDYENNGYFFVYYTVPESDPNEVPNFRIELARYQRLASDPDSADPESKTVLLAIDKNINQTNHNGGKLNFGPDGHLYFGVGDGGGGNDPQNYAQRPDSLMGKLVRINVDNFAASPYYSIPNDNPYAFNVDTAEQIFAFGLRNPWRWSFDRLTGDIWLADVGQSTREEVNFVPAGTPGGYNFGWRCYEGTNPHITTGCQPASAYLAPIFDYPRENLPSATGGISVTGGYVYRGATYPRMYGYYIMADYQSGNAWSIGPDGSGGWTVTLQNQNVPSAIVSFGETESGELLMLALSGTVYSVQALTSVPVKITGFSGEQKTESVLLKWITEEEQNVETYNVEYSLNGIDFSPAGSVAAAGRKEYSFTHNFKINTKTFYRLRIVDKDSKFEYSKLLVMNPAPITTNSLVAPNIITNGMLRLNLTSSYNALRLIDMQGREIWKQNLSGRTGTLNVQLPSGLRGYYEVQVIGNSQSIRQRVFVKGR